MQWMQIYAQRSSSSNIRLSILLLPFNCFYFANFSSHLKFVADFLSCRGCGLMLKTEIGICQWYTTMHRLNNIISIILFHVKDLELATSHSALAWTCGRTPSWSHKNASNVIATQLKRGGDEKTYSTHFPFHFGI